MTLHVGIIGAGAAARQHAAAARAAGMCVSTVADREWHHARRLADELGVAPVTVAQLCVSQYVDLVAICTPPGSRKELALTALDGKKHILLEKPVAPTVAEHDAIVQAADAAGRIAGVMHQHRLRLAESDVLALVWPEDTIATVAVSRPREQHHYSGWRQSLEMSGGGAVAHLGVHYLDMLCQLLGEPAELSAYVRRDCRAVDVAAVIAMTFSGGQIATAQIATDAQKRVGEIRLETRNQSLSITEAQTVAILHGKRHVTAAAPVPSMRTAVYSDIKEAIYAGYRPHYASAHTARGGIKIIEAVGERLRTPR